MHFCKTESGQQGRKVVGFLLALTFTVGVHSGQAGQRIAATLDPNGRVIFTNDPPAAQNLRVAQPPEASAASDSSAATDAVPTAEPSPVRTPSATPVRVPSNTAAAIDGLIEQAATQHQVDPELVRAIVRVESNYNPRAVSPKGARGLMQLIPLTARRFGVRDAFDPAANLDGGIRYLKYLLGLFEGDLRLSLAAYNAGENIVGKVRGVPPFRETRDYLRKIAQIYPIGQPARVPAARIAKFIDGKGTVHFSNTDLP